jgi:hypothetical protein
VRLDLIPSGSDVFREGPLAFKTTVVTSGFTEYQMRSPRRRCTRIEHLLSVRLQHFHDVVVSGLWLLD